MRILITGGFGFIGGRLAQHLLKAGHHVVLGSRTHTSSPDWLPEVDVVQANWNDCFSLKQICTGIDVVIHAAGMNARECAQNPVVALECNGLATARLVEIFKNDPEAMDALPSFAGRVATVPADQVIDGEPPGDRPARLKSSTKTETELVETETFTGAADSRRMKRCCC